MAGRLWVGDFALPSSLSPLNVRHPRRESPNMAPRQPITVVRRLDEGLVQDECFWGLTPSWLKVLDHAPHCARAESLFERAMFKEAIATRRCLIPVSGIYVWKPQPKRKQPFLVVHAKRRPLLLAALWTRFEQSVVQQDSCALITVPAIDHLDALTDRLPAMIAPHAARKWLDPELELSHVSQMLARPYPEPIGAYPVSTLVNDPAHQDRQCTHPTGPFITDASS
ncbi:SOS response-associated peptidase [Larsenimonas salina]|uniref:SOS response-associated peptidase n=1 Tax=Larsenimonas salina TaxID=1295565 RepID=UPI0020737AAE|nr:SOS response-associated peptidase [Larsenimonas salina]MCM5705567.1 SOS response-associated peptidase [Larsenimonas salina]